MDIQSKIDALKQCIKTLEAREAEEYQCYFAEGSFDKYNFNEYEFLKNLKKTGGVLGGSFVLNQYIKNKQFKELKTFDPKDIDVFFNHKEQGKITNFIEFLLSKNYKKVSDICSRYDNVHSVATYASVNGATIEIVKTKLDPIEHVSKSDLSCCRLYFDYDKKDIVATGKWYDAEYTTDFHIELEKTKTINRTKIMRLMKYVDRGFIIFIKNESINDFIKFWNHQYNSYNYNMIGITIYSFMKQIEKEQLEEEEEEEEEE